MPASPTELQSIYNYVELGLTILMGIAVAAFSGFGNHYSESQFVDAIVYGFLIINIIVVMMIFLKEDVGVKQRLCITGTAMITFLLVAVILLLELILYHEHYSTFGMIRVIIALAASIAAGVCYILDFILNLKNN